MNNVLGGAKALWSKEQIKAEVMLSLTLQLVLIFLTPLRKKSNNKRLLLLLWLAYLGADYVATMALGSILANKAGEDLPGQSLTAFWAPFLLLHLGGPDNITSYSIEDNELWLRHLLSFGIQVSTALVVVVKSNLQTSRLLMPTLLIFIVGTIKFGERTLALRAASMQKIKNSVESEGKRDLIGTLDINGGGPFIINDGAAMFINGYLSFLVLKPHIVGTTMSWDEYGLWLRQLKRDLKLVGVELSFLYDILHTKATFIHSAAGRVIRIASLVLTATALFLFYIREKGGYESSDLVTTYILLSVALFLDFYSVLYLVASKWMIISLSRLGKYWDKDFCSVLYLAAFISRAKKQIFYRSSKDWWSDCIGQYNLIQSVIRKNNQGSNWFKNARDFLLRGEESAEVPNILEGTVKNHIKKILEPELFEVEFSDLLRKIRSSWITNTLDRYQLKNVMKKSAFDECVIVWHMATDIFYVASNNEPVDSMEGRRREAMYRVSNYMMFLIFERSSMMPAGIAEKIIVETVHEIGSITHNGHNNKQACLSFYGMIRGDNMPQLGYKTHSAWPLVWHLVVQLKEIAATRSEREQWEVICDAWMEMLTYAAVVCSRREHFRGLSRGGEFLTHYWLLLAHYGILEEHNAAAAYKLR